VNLKFFFFFESAKFIKLPTAQDVQEGARKDKTNYNQWNYSTTSADTNRGLKTTNKQ
jgi:hypothetical protein